MSTASPKRPLEPTERISEALFGLIMVLTFTGSLSVANAGRDDVRTMLIGAVGCNLAWGIIDAIFYLMGCLGEQAGRIRLFDALRKAAAPEDARQVIAESLPPMVAAALTPTEFDSIHQQLIRMPAPPSRPRLAKRDWLAALSVFLWVFTVTFPVAIPFIFMAEVARAMRVSNAIAIVLLFLCGYAYSRVVGSRPWLTGLAMVVLGVVLVGITIALGG
jgi:VIT1/CCC1 family predicted Fe2+/Mn2+ transporter